MVKSASVLVFVYFVGMEILTDFSSLNKNFGCG